MPVRNLDKIFQPKRVAVIGASRKAGSVGHTVLHNLVEGGFPGDVYPVNPKYKTLERLPAFAKIGDTPEVADLAIICTPSATVPDIVGECGDSGVRGLIIISAGFRELGKSGGELERKVLDRAKQFDGMRILGPNCLGIVEPHVPLNASFVSAAPAKGHVAFISQSGALCTSVLDWAAEEKVGFSHFVSVGNMLDVGIGDLIDYFAMDQRTRSIILYVESIDEARNFMSAARAFARDKPIIAYKAGRFAQSAQAAASHTGAMAGIDEVYEAAFARAGIVRVFDIDDMFDCAELLARRKTPKGPHLAIITNAGGPGVIATDALIDRAGVLAELGEAAIDKLNNCLPEAWSHANPVDVLGDAAPQRFGDAVKIVLADPQVDAALVILTPQAMTDPTAAAKTVVEAASRSAKPVLAAWMGAAKVRKGITLLNEAGIPTYASPEQAVRAFMHLVDYARNRRVLYETPRDIPVEFPLDRGKLRAVFNTILSEGHDTLSEGTSKALLEAYEIPVTRPFVARSPEDAVQLAQRVGYPVAMKIKSPQITHKTEVGGVALDLANDDAVLAAFQRMTTEAKDKRPDAQIEGVTIQKMVTTPVGYELIIGAKRDNVFGVVLIVGAGGITAELYQDIAMGLPPLNEQLARRMLESLHSWPLLQGYRGRPAMNVDRLIEMLIRFSYLIADYPEIKEIDVNPLLVTPQDVTALDARIILDHEAILHPPRPYSHLSIRPYPEELVKSVSLQNKTPVLLRPIKPEDEPMWHALLARCSQESLWSRFRYVFKETTHEMATRFCFIDYDREIAIVAEIEDDGERKLIGVGRLLADADHREAEYAVLVADAYQGTGLGTILTTYCLEICQSWGIRRVVAETAPANNRMLAIFKKLGFDLDYSLSPDVVLGAKNLAGGREHSIQ